MLVRDDRAWVSGGRTEPWMGLFDAVLGAQLDLWPCGSYGSCLAMASMATMAALREQAAAEGAPSAQGGNSGGGAAGGSSGLAHSNSGSSLGVHSVPEDNLGEAPRSSWRLVTGHDNGQLLLWAAAEDVLRPLVVVGEPGGSAVRGIAVVDPDGVLAVAHANGDLALFTRPADDADWHLASADGADEEEAWSAPGGAASSPSPVASRLLLRGSSSGSGRRMAGGSSSGGGGGGGAFDSAGSSALASAALLTIKPRRVVLQAVRGNVVAAAACSAGMVTASSSGKVRLWPAKNLVQEAERCGLALLPPLHVAPPRDSSSPPRRLTTQLFTPPPAPPAPPAAPATLPQSDKGFELPDAASLSASAALQALQQQAPRSQPMAVPTASKLELGGLAAQLQALQALQTQQQQQQQQLEAASDAASTQPPSAMSSASNLPPGAVAAPPPAPREWRCSTGGSPAAQVREWRCSTGGSLAAQVLAPEPDAAATSPRAAVGSLAYAHAVAQQQLAQLCSSPRAVDAGGASSYGSPVVVAGHLGGGGAAPPMSPHSGSPFTSGGRHLQAPRAPAASRNSGSGGGGGGAGSTRERRKSERRLSKGANLAWSTCQIIEASELPL
jgi:hypothetical protein